jgi:NitT/TauT family transport system permease protein
MKKTIWKNCIAWATAIALLIGVWVVAYYAIGNDLLVPSFSDCLQKMGELFLSSAFWTAFFMTLKRVLIAFLFAFVFAVIFSIISYLVPWFSLFIAPIISVLRSMPVLGVLLIILIWAGASTAPIVVAFLSLFPMLYASFHASLSQVDRKLVEMSRVYKVPTLKRVWKLFLPSAAPIALRESGAALAFCVKLVVSAEVLASTFKSLGGLMQEGKMYLDMPLLFALVCVTFLLGLLLETLGGVVATCMDRSWK